MTTEERITNALKSATDTKVFKMGKNILHLVPQTFKELFPGGGVTFGGGEPLLQAAFIREFIGFVRSLGKNWRFAVETSLAVPEENLSFLLGEDENGGPLVSEWIVDVKDTDPAVYEAYTGLPLDRMRKNLGRLAALCPSRVVVRVPLIPGYNTPEACTRSEKTLRDMGFENIDRFDYVLPKGK